MTERDYFSSAPEFAPFPSASIGRSTMSPQHSRKSSTDSNAVLRELLRPWGTLSSTPPGCRTVSFSSWTRFTASTTTTAPPGELKASILCKDSGLATSYDPPVSEWTYLGAAQPIFPGKPENVRRRRQKRQRSSASWTTVSSTSDGGAPMEPAKFQKRELKRVNTNSQLTCSLNTSPVPEKQPSQMERMMKRLGMEGMNCEELPSAFDSDSEEEE